MKISHEAWRRIACGALSLALVGGVGCSASAASNGASDNSANTADHHKELRAIHEKMLAQAKADDAALGKMIVDLNKAPEAKKADLEAAILAKLVAEHHQLLADCESLHSHMMKIRHEHNQTTKNETWPAPSAHGPTG